MDEVIAGPIDWLLCVLGWSRSPWTCSWCLRLTTDARHVHGVDIYESDGNVWSNGP